VGQIGTNSGLLGTFLEAAKTGAEIWVSYINQHGGLNGHKVNLITADDGGDPSTGLSEVQTMVQQDHIIALISSDDILSEPTIATYLDQVQVPDIGGDDVVTQWYTNPMFFPIGSSARIATDGAMKNAFSEGHTKIGIIACVEFALVCANITSIVQADAAALGGQVVYDANVSLAQPDYTSECLGAKAAGANVLFMAVDANSVIRMAQDCSNQGYTPQYLQNAVVLAPVLFSTPLTQGMTVGGGFFPFPEVAPQTATFDQAVQQVTGGPPTSSFEAGAWLAGLVLQAASAHLPASNPTPADVLAGLYQIKDDTFGGLTPAITYTQGQPTTSPTCYYIIEVGKTQYEAPNGMQSTCLPSAFAPPSP
jgi:branched-chain amino acid transport system substrate-binding protein